MLPSFRSAARAAAAALLLAFASAAGAQEAERTYGTRELGLEPGVVDAACREGRLQVYSLILGNIPNNGFPEFRRRFPCIAIESFAASGGALTQRFTSEFQAGTRSADIVMNSSPAYGDRMVAGRMLVEWSPPTGGLIPPQWQRAGYWYTVGLSYIGMAWNTQEVSAQERAWLESVTTWEQVLGAPFRGNAALTDIRAGGSMQLPFFFLRETYGRGSWERLAALRPTMFSAVNPLSDRLAAGEFAFSPVVSTDTAIGVRWAQGAPLRWKFPEPGLAVPYFIGIAANAPRPNAAKVFLAWSLTVEGQSAWVLGSGLAPASPHAVDGRAFARESWYRLPSRMATADWNALEQQWTTLAQEFRTVFGQ